MRTLTIVLLVVAIAVLLKRNQDKEGFFGFSGWNGGYLSDGVTVHEKIREVNMNDFVRNTDDGIPRELWSNLVETAQVELNKYTSLCLVPFLTIWAHIYDGPNGDRLYKWRSMYVAGREQIGVEIEATALVRADTGDIELVSLETNQPFNSSDKIKAFYPDQYKDYMQFNNIVMNNRPNKDALTLVEGAIARKFRPMRRPKPKSEVSAGAVGLELVNMGS
jgi:hypothetical protein